MKHYKTKKGAKARIICTDCNNEVYPVVALITGDDSGKEYVETYTEDLRVWCGEESDEDLVEVSAWDGFEIDEPVLLDTGRRAHFAGIDAAGCPTVWLGGRTSHTQVIGRYVCEDIRKL